MTGDANRDDYHTVDFGYAAGLGYQMTKGLSVGLRYNGGLVNISKQDDDKFRNNAFQLYLTYMFGTK